MSFSFLACFLYFSQFDESHSSSSDLCMFTHGSCLGDSYRSAFVAFKNIQEIFSQQVRLSDNAFFLVLNLLLFCLR